MNENKTLAESENKELMLYRYAWDIVKEHGGECIIDYNEGYFMTGKQLNVETESNSYNPESIYWSEIGEADDTLIEFKTWEDFMNHYMEGRI